MAVYTLTGSGTQALTANTSRLVVDVLASPSTATNGRATPTNLFDVGLLRLGVAGSFSPVHPIDAASMFIDCPLGVNQLGYSLFGPASIRVTEQFSTNPTNPTRIQRAYSAVVPAGSTNLALWTYTVPANRVARVSAILAGIANAGAANSNTSVQIAGATLAYLLPNGATNPQLFNQTYLPTPIYAVAGDVVAAYGTTPAGGTCQMLSSMLAVEFDAATWDPDR